MNQYAIVINDFRMALKAFEPMVKDPEWLRTGRPIRFFSLRPREAWANWLLCVVLRRLGDPFITFTEDAEGDGILFDPCSGHWVQTEHVSRLDVASKNPLAEGDQGIINAINQKIDHGPGYAKNKYLVVFFEGVGEFVRKKIRSSIRGRHSFDMVFGIGLLTVNEKGYEYAVTQYHDFHSITYIVKIKNDFSDWSVTDGPLPM